MKNVLPLILVILALGFFSSSNAQEVKEVKEARVKIVKNVNGETIVVDTTLQGEHGEINDILKDLGVDEEVEITMDLDIDVDEDGKHMIFVKNLNDTIITETIVVGEDGIKGKKGKAQFITFDMDSEVIEVDGDKEIMVTVQAAMDEAMDAMHDEKGNIKMIMKSFDGEEMEWFGDNGDSIKIIIGAEMEKLGKELEDIHIYMSEPGKNDFFFDGGHMDNFNHFDFYGEVKGCVTLSDLNDEQWKYFNERGHKNCRNTFTPMDIYVNVKPNKDALKLAFTVTPDDEYDVLLLNEDFTPILDETFTMSAGSYERSVDIPGDHDTFYLQIVKGKSCYTKVVGL